MPSKKKAAEATRRSYNKKTPEELLASHKEFIEKAEVRIEKLQDQISHREQRIEKIREKIAATAATCRNNKPIVLRSIKKKSKRSR